MVDVNLAENPQALEFRRRRYTDLHSQTLILCEYDLQFSTLGNVIFLSNLAFAQEQHRGPLPKDSRVAKQPGSMCLYRCVLVGF